MALAALSLEWVGRDEFLRLTKMSPRTATAWAKRELAQATRQGRPPRVRLVQGQRGRPSYEYHYSFHPRLERFPERQQRNDEARATLLTQYPERVAHRAWTRATVVNEYKTACARGEFGTKRQCAARVVAEAKQRYPELKGLSVRNLERWAHEYDRPGDDGQILGARALVDRYGRDKDNNAPSRSPEAIEYFMDCYRVRSQPTLAKCHRMTLRESSKNGWNWPRTYESTNRWIKDNDDDPSFTYLCREGEGEWSKKYLPHVPIDDSGLEPGEMYQADHHRCDFWVTYRHENIRPWLTAVQDYKTRCIVGWHLGPEPHQDAILSALRMAFREWAIPRVVRIDNGKDFASKLITGVTKQERDQLRRAYGRDWKSKRESLQDCTDARWIGITGALGIDVIYATPYAPWSKGRLERWFGTFEDDCGKSFETYCGSSQITKPECLQDILRGYTKDQRRDFKKQYGPREWLKRLFVRLVDQTSISTLADARAKIGEWINDVYNVTEHRIDDGRPAIPNDLFWKASTRRKADEDELIALMQARGYYRVTGNGVTFKIGSGNHTYANTAALKKYVGKDVLIRIDDRDISHCHAFAKRGDDHVYVARLESVERIPPHTCTDEEREVIAEKKREQSVMHKARRAQAKKTRTFAQRLTAHNREIASELRATGTHDARPVGNVELVRSPLGELSIPVRTKGETTEPDESIDDLFEAFAMKADNDWERECEEPDSDDDFDFEFPDPNEAPDDADFEDDDEVDLPGPATSDGPPENEGGEE